MSLDERLYWANRVMATGIEKRFLREARELVAQWYEDVGPFEIADANVEDLEELIARSLRQAWKDALALSAPVAANGQRGSVRGGIKKPRAIRSDR